MVTAILVKTLNKVSNLPFHIMFIANEMKFFFFPASIWKPLGHRQHRQENFPIIKP